MKVHIVTHPGKPADWVCARMAKALADGTGWTLSESPDPGAAANIYALYLTLRDGWHETPTLAWFSHRDTTIRGKEQLWDNAKKKVDVRTTSARMYLPGLAEHGPSCLVTPPLDRVKFSPAPKRQRPNNIPLIGASGYSYKGCRKGEQLVGRLALEHPEYRVIASGKGWPVSTREYPWPELHEFYRSIDLYLCTASVEGVPYPPLEALAVGVPIVIPRGVGLLDDLPSIPGIERYDVGDYPGMVNAIERALAGRGDAEQLRAATEPYTAERWCSDWQAAVSELLGPALPTVELAPVQVSTERRKVRRRVPRWKGKAGVFVVAYGDPARDCARRLIASIRVHMPGLPVALVCSEPLGVEDITIIHPDEDLGARSAKTLMGTLAPAAFELCAYLDADVELLQPIEAIFDILADGFDIAMAPCPEKYSTLSSGLRPDNADELRETIAIVGTGEALQYGGGVMGFKRSPHVLAFLAAWHEQWKQHAKRDQMAFDRALYASPLRVWTLSTDWNLVDRYSTPDARTVILHHPTEARRWRGIVPGRLDSRAARKMAERAMALHPDPPPALVAR